MKKIIGLIVALALFSCGKSPDTPAEVTVEFRLAELEPAPDLTETVFSGTGERFFLHKEAAISNADVASATVVKRGERPQIEVTFTAMGREKFAQLTRANLNKRVGILVDGQLLSAPTIRAPIEHGKALIIGDFTEQEARRIADGIIAR